MLTSNINGLVRKDVVPMLPVLDEDILYHIFDLSCGDKSIKIESEKHQIWTLRQVCSHWHITIDASPMFWNRWEIHYPADVSESAIAIRTQLCIKNSKTLPLYVSITETPYPSRIRCSELFCHALSSNLADLSRHCVNLKIPGQCLKAVIKDAEETEWPNLRVLSLVGGEITSNMIRGIKALRELELNGVCIYKTDGFHLSEVKKLTFRSCYMRSPQNRIYDIIKTAPLLEELAWLDSNNTWWRSDDWTDPIILDVEQPVTLNNLHTLRLHIQKHALEIYVLPMICTPNIRTLGLNVPPSPNCAITSLAKFTERSKFRIKRLELTSTHLTHILPFVRDYLQDVEEISLTDCPRSRPWRPPSEEFRDELSYSFDALITYSMLLPSLQKLEIYHKSCAKFALLNFLKNRYMTSDWDDHPKMNIPQKRLQLAPLKHLKYSTVHYTEDEKELLEELNNIGRECGFEVEVEILEHELSV